MRDFQIAGETSYDFSKMKNSTILGHSTASAALFPGPDESCDSQCDAGAASFRCDHYGAALNRNAGARAKGPHRHCSGKFTLFAGNFRFNCACFIYVGRTGLNWLQIIRCGGGKSGSAITSIRCLEGRNREARCRPRSDGARLIGFGRTGPLKLGEGENAMLLFVLKNLLPLNA
jgi:hypothetical protein